MRFKERLEIFSDDSDKDISDKESFDMQNHFGSCDKSSF